MAIRLEDEYTNSTPASVDYPEGSFKNATSGTAQDGTPFEKVWADDIYGFLQALLAEAVITPSGTADTALVSQYLLAIQTLIATAAVPVGTVVWKAANIIPTGYLKANGAAVSRTTYAALFADIGVVFGVGDSSTTFNLPDLRGEFVRGWDDGKGLDKGRALGSNQDEDFKAHTHDMAQSGDYTAPGPKASMDNGQDVIANYLASESTGGIETRPRNVALLACIKY